MNELKKLFRRLQTDSKSVLFTEENINEDEKSSIPIKTTFVEKKDDIDRSTLYSFDGPFQLLHADAGNLGFLGKSATDPKYCLLFVELFTSKVYVHPISLESLF